MLMQTLQSCSLPIHTIVEEDNNNYVTYKFRYNYGDFVTPLVCATRL